MDIRTFAIAAAIGVGTSPVWAALLSALTKAAASLVVSLVIHEVTMQSTYEAVVIGYLGANFRWFNTGGDHFYMSWEFVKPVQEKRNIWFHQLNENWRIFWYRGAPLLVVAATAGGSGEVSKPCRIFSLRGTINVERLLIESEEFQRASNVRNQESRVGRFRVVRHTGGGFSDKGEAKHDKSTPKLERSSNLGSSGIGTILKPVGWAPEDLGPTAQGSSLDDLSLAPDLLDCVRDIRFWNSRKDWYDERGIPWRRGYGLYGKPGTGKTSLIRAIAEDLNMPVDVFDLASMSNSSFMEAWESSRANGGGAPHAVVFEDFDAVFDARRPEGGRKNLVSQFGVSFDCILNALDGIERESGLLIFITTNHIDALDPALGVPKKDGRPGDSTRPGRIDRVIEVKALDLAGRIKMARRILQDEQWAQEMAADNNGDTAAQFQERCASAALRMLWNQDAAA